MFAGLQEEILENLGPRAPSHQRVGGGGISQSAFSYT